MEDLSPNKEGTRLLNIYFKGFSDMGCVVEGMLVFATLSSMLSEIPLLRNFLKGTFCRLTKRKNTSNEFSTGFLY